MSGRVITVGAAQLGPVARGDSRASVVERMITLLRAAAERGANLVVFPELALTSFFPRWNYEDGDPELESWFETEMPSRDTKPLWDEAARLGVGFCLGFAERTPEGGHFNTAVLVAPDGGEPHRVAQPVLPDLGGRWPHLLGRRRRLRRARHDDAGGRR